MAYLLYQRTRCQSQADVGSCHRKNGDLVAILGDLEPAEAAHENVVGNTIESEVTVGDPINTQFLN